MSEALWAGVLLVAGFMLFLLGAAFWKPAVYQQALPLALRAMANDRRRLTWIHAWMCIGTMVTTLGMCLLAGVLRSRGDRVLSTIAVALFAEGAVLLLVSLAFRLTVQDWAASQTVDLGTVPEGYAAWPAGRDHSTPLTCSAPTCPGR